MLASSPPRALLGLLLLAALATGQEAQAPAAGLGIVIALTERALQSREGLKAGAIGFEDCPHLQIGRVAIGLLGAADVIIRGAHREEALCLRLCHAHAGVAVHIEFRAAIGEISPQLARADVGGVGRPFEIHAGV